MARLRQDPEPQVLAFLPFGDRLNEGMRMFSLLKGDWLYDYAWGGYFPPFSSSLIRSFRDMRIRKLFAQLNAIYPDVRVVVDKTLPAPGRRDADIPFQHFKGESSKLDWVAIAREFADQIDSDRRFAHFRLRPLPPAPKIDKAFRNDVGRQNPEMFAVLEGAAETPVSLSLNGTVLGQYSMPKEGRLDIHYDMEGHPLHDCGYNVLTFQSGTTNTLRLSSFRLSSHDGRFVDVCHREVLPPSEGSTGGHPGKASKE
jgi:hypothetical protein